MRTLAAQIRTQLNPTIIATALSNVQSSLDLIESRLANLGEPYVPQSDPTRIQIHGSALVKGSVAAEYIDTINASQIVGLIQANQIENVNANQIVGSITASQIGSVNADVIQGLIQSGQIQNITAGQITGVIVTSQLADSILDTAKLFADAFKPIQRVATLPTLPDSNYPVNSLVLLSTDKKIYKNVAGTWTVTAASDTLTGHLTAVDIDEVNASAIIGLITAAQIDSIAATQITGLIQAGQINTITAGQLTGQIVGSQIGTAQITGTHIASATITGTNIASTTITASNIANATITADQIVNLTITGGKIANATIDNAKISDLSADKINAGTLSAARIAAHTLTIDKLLVGTYDNVIENPSFEQAAGWTITSPTMDRNYNAGGQQHGLYAMRKQGGGDNGGAYQGPFTVAPGDKYYIAGYLDNGGATSGSMWFGFYYKDKDGNGIGWGTLASASCTDPDYLYQWKIASAVDTAPAGAVSALFYAYATNPDGSVYFDNIYVRRIIGTAIIDDAAITTAKIGNLQVTGAKIADATIGNAKISDLSADKINTGTLNASVVNVTNLNATNITTGTLDVANRVTDGAISGAKIANLTITAAHIANATITSTQISGTAGITGGQIASATITGSNIASTTITASNIAGLTITADQIANLTITGGKIADATIGNAKISDLSADKVNAGTLAAARIAANSLQVNKLIVGRVDDLAEDPGFEISGAFDGSAAWTLSGSGSASRTSSAPHGGLYCASITIGSGTGDTSLQSRPMFCEPGEKFVYFVWGKWDAGAGAGCVLFIAPYFYDGSGNGLGWGTWASVLAGTTTWTQVGTSGVAPTSAASFRILLYAYNPSQNGVGTCYVDDVQFRRMVSTAFIEDAAITQAKIANLAVGTAQIADAAITNAKINDLSAAKINTGTLTVGGSGTNANISVKNASDTEIAWIGKSGTDYGIWGQTLRAGGSGFSTATFRVSSSALELDNALITITDATRKITIGPSAMTIKLEFTGTSKYCEIHPLAIDIKDDTSSHTHLSLSSNNFYLQNLSGGAAADGKVVMNVGSGSAYLYVTNSSGGYRFNVGGGPAIYLGDPLDFNNGTATTATAGSYTLPANPAGFLNISVAGSAKKVPYYNT